MEPTEMQEFSKQVKEGGEESLTTISLAISILAVLVAMVTVLGHRTHTEAVLSQSRATDQWNLYQAKKIRWDNLNVVIDTLKLNADANPAARTPALAKKLLEYHDHIEKWKEDLAESATEAHKLEAEVAIDERKASHFDMGEALLQIAVVVCSITLFTRRKGYYILGLIAGAIGLAVSASAFLVH